MAYPKHQLLRILSKGSIPILKQDFLKVELEIKVLEEKAVQKETKEIDMELVMANIEYFLKHLEFLLFSSPNRINRGIYFGLLFEEAPTYEEINSGTPQLAPFLKLNEQESKDLQALLPNCEPERSRTSNQFLKREPLCH